MAFDEKPQENEPGLIFTESAEHDWRAYLKDFKNDVYPVFEEYGFTLPDAFALWMNNRLYNQIEKLLNET